MSNRMCTLLQLPLRAAIQKAHASGADEGAAGSPRADRVRISRTSSMSGESRLLADERQHLDHLEGNFTHAPYGPRHASMDLA